MKSQRTNKAGGRVDDLHMTYLQASLEGFRRSAHSLLIISGGAVVALLGLFPVLLPQGVGAPTVAAGMRWPVASFLAAAIAAVVAQLVFSLSAHGAAWGQVARERWFRWAGIIALALGICFFSLGAFAAIEVVGNTSPFEAAKTQ